MHFVECTHCKKPMWRKLKKKKVCCFDCKTKRVNKYSKEYKEKMKLASGTIKTEQEDVP